MSWSNFKGLGALAVLACMVGAGIIMWGWTEWRVSRHAAAEPMTVDLAALKGGQPLDNHHVSVGPHYALYYSVVYSYWDKKVAPVGPKAETKLQHCYYPIVATTHPGAQELARLQNEPGGVNDLPPGKRPRVDNFIILVKTDRFKTVSEIPTIDIKREEAVQGLIINEIRPLKPSEQALVREVFPKMNFSRVWILEEGRTPSSLFSAYARMIGGAVLIVVGLIGGLVVIVFGLMGLSKSPSRPAPPPLRREPR